MCFGLLRTYSTLNHNLLTSYSFFLSYLTSAAVYVCRKRIHSLKTKHRHWSFEAYTHSLFHFQNLVKMVKILP